jgi:hypothetical protein
VFAGDWAAPWSREAIDAVLDLARGRPGRHRDLPNGSTARRDRVYVRVSRPSPGKKRAQIQSARGKGKQ